MLHLIQTVVSNPSPYEYVFQHLQVVGWPTLVYLAWRVSKFFDRASHQVVKTITQIDAMATNHFPHMEDSLAKQDKFMESMDGSLKTIASNSSRRREQN